MLLFTSKEILGLEVAVCNVELVAVVHSGDELLKVSQRLRRGESAAAAEVVEEFTPFDVFHDEVEICGRLPDVV